MPSYRVLIGLNHGCRSDGTEAEAWGCRHEPGEIVDGGHLGSAIVAFADTIPAVLELLGDGPPVEE